MRLEELKALIDSEIDRLEKKSEPANLYEPISYILSLKGKRIRPLLVLLGYSLFKDDPEKVIKPALAVEVFHNFTLMHDDIMDKAPLRRGMPTVHEKWDEITAILSGDTMMIQAYKSLEDVEDKYLPEVLKLFNTCAIEVCEGQQMDMNFESRDDVTEEEYLEMIRLKTAVLLGFSLQFGALLGGADAIAQNQIRDFGINLGLAFQLMDDHLDTFGDSSTFGKQIGGDIVSNKKTFLLITALRRSSTQNRKKLIHWLNAESSDDQGKIDNIKAVFKDEGVDILSLDKIHSYESSAIENLNELKGNEAVKEVIFGYLMQLKKRVE